MTPDTFTVPAFLTGRLDTPTGIANSLAFDLTDVDLGGGGLAVELLIEQAPRVGSARVDIRDEDGRIFGCARIGAGAGPIRVPLNSSASEELRRASGGFFTVEAMLADAEGTPQAFTLGTRHVGWLTVVPRDPAVSLSDAA